LLGFFQT